MLAILVMTPLRVSYTIETMLATVPIREWRVERGADGIVCANLMDLQSGLLLHSLQLDFERGDQVNIRYHLDGQGSPVVAEGQKIITVESAELEQRIIQVASQLRVEEHNKQALATGQKRQLIQQMQAQVELAKQELSLQQKNFERIKELYEKEVVPLAEYERATTAYQEALANVNIAEKALEVAITGEKAETVAVAIARINALKSELEFLRRRKSDYELNSPLSGFATYETTPNGVAFVVKDTSALILQIPLKMREQQFLMPGQLVRVKIKDTGQIIEAHIASVDAQPKLFGGEWALVLNVVPEAGQKVPLWPVPVRCELILGKVTLREFLRRAIRWQ